MSDQTIPKTGITRRGFLKATGAAAGAAALIGGGTLTALAEGEALSGEDEIFYGGCRGNCAGGCRLRVKKRNGVIVQTEAADFSIPEFNRICAKGLSYPQRVYNPLRVQYPMRRVAGTPRGGGQWERISWDEAIGEITAKWKDDFEKYGPTSAIICNGSGNNSFEKNCYTYLAQLMGATTTSPTFDAAGMAEQMRQVGFGPFFAGHGPGSERETDFSILLGFNPCNATIPSFHHLLDARDRGAELVHIDPVYNMTSSRCSRYIPIRVGSDTALLLAMIHECVANGWTNEDVILTDTVGPYLVKDETGDYLRMSDLGIEPTEGPISPYTGMPTVIDPIVVWDLDANAPVPEGSATNVAVSGSYVAGGIPVKTAYQCIVDATDEWTVEKAEELTTIPAATITELADKFANTRNSSISIGYGIEHYNGGHHAYHAAGTLCAITGQIGRPGAGWAGLSSFNLGSAFLINPNLTVRDVPQGPQIGLVHLARVAQEKQIRGIPVNFHSILYYCINVVPNVTERKKTLEFLDSLDMVVVCDIVMTETCQYADYVLPVAGWMEHEDIMPSPFAPYINWQEQVIDPLYESKNDYEIVKLLAEGMGLGDNFPWEHRDYLLDFLENPNAQGAGITRERLLEEKSCLMFPDGQYVSGAGGVYPSTTGKFEFYHEKPNPINAMGGMCPDDPFDSRMENVPSFEPPHEAWYQNELIEKYPLVFMSNRNKFRTHTQYFECSWLAELQPEPVLRIGPVDAEARGIKTGDYVRAFNDRGECVLRAEVNNGISSGVVVYPKGWQRDEFKLGHASDLSSQYSHPAMPNNYYFDVLCEVEKWEEGE